MPPPTFPPHFFGHLRRERSKLPPLALTDLLVALWVARRQNYGTNKPTRCPVPFLSPNAPVCPGQGDSFGLFGGDIPEEPNKQSSPRLVTNVNCSFSPNHCSPCFFTSNCWILWFNPLIVSSCDLIVILSLQFSSLLASSSCSRQNISRSLSPCCSFWLLLSMSLRNAIGRLSSSCSPSETQISDGKIGDSPGCSDAVVCLPTYANLCPLYAFEPELRTCDVPNIMEESMGPGQFARRRHIDFGLSRGTVFTATSLTSWRKAWAQVKMPDGGTLILGSLRRL